MRIKEDTLATFVAAIWLGSMIGALLNLSAWQEWANAFSLDNGFSYGWVVWLPVWGAPAFMAFVGFFFSKYVVSEEELFKERVANNPELQKMNRMYVYAWEDLNTPGEIKFGEHWVNNETLRGGARHTIKYIRNSLGRLRHKFDRGDIEIHTILDVTEYAKSKGRFYRNSKVDDVIRKEVLTRRIGRSEFHEMNPEKLVSRVKKEVGYL